MITLDSFILSMLFTNYNELNLLPLGRILFAKSRNGIDDWKFHEDGSVLGPNKENGDWFYFDSDHVGK